MQKTHIIIHHSATDSGDVEAFRRYHKSLGWRDVGYNWVITREGVVQKGRDESDTGAHCKEQNMNRLSIGICLTGNFDNYAPNEKQMEALRKLVQEIMARHNIPIENIKKHSDYASYKSCPGAQFPFDEFINSLNTTVPTMTKEQAIKLIEQGLEILRANQ